MGMRDWKVWGAGFEDDTVTVTMEEQEALSELEEQAPPAAS
ncbi:hypothetical protein ACRAKI_17720 [Saccharothrix isguenensis]